MREETGLFQPDECLHKEVSIPIDKEHYFHDCPGTVPDVTKL